MRSYLLEQQPQLRLPQPMDLVVVVDGRAMEEEFRCVCVCVCVCVCACLCRGQTPHTHVCEQERVRACTFLGGYFWACDVCIMCMQ